MNLFYIAILLTFSLINIAEAKPFFSIGSAGEEGETMMLFSHNEYGSIFDTLSPNAEEASKIFSKNLSKKNYDYNGPRITYINDNNDIYNTNSEIKEFGYIRRFCGIVRDVKISQFRELTQPPLVSLVIMSSAQVMVPFRSSSHMELNKKTLDYYTNSYLGKEICVNKAGILKSYDREINYIIPYTYDQSLLDINYDESIFIKDSVFD